MVWEPLAPSRWWLLGRGPHAGLFVSIANIEQMPVLGKTCTPHFFFFFLEDDLCTNELLVKQVSIPMRWAHIGSGFGCQVRRTTAVVAPEKPMLAAGQPVA